MARTSSSLEKRTKMRPVGTTSAPDSPIEYKGMAEAGLWDDLSASKTLKVLSRVVSSYKASLLAPPSSA